MTAIQVAELQRCSPRHDLRAGENDFAALPLEDGCCGIELGYGVGEECQELI